MSQQILDLIKQGAVVVDVRTPEEFRMGSNPKSINIPLDQLSQKAKTLKPEATLLLCCASGARSGVGVTLLKGFGFKAVYNAGPWENTVT